MNDAARKAHAPAATTLANRQAITIDEVFPHAPEIIWKAITTGSLMGRWMMAPEGFEPVVGNRFTFTTTPAGKWDGRIRCEVLEMVPNQRFVIAWRSGDDGNVGYGATLDTTVTFTLTPAPKSSGGGTRLAIVHAGFELPKNDTAYQNMSGGWVKCVAKLGGVASGEG